MDYNDFVNVKTGILMASMYVSLCYVYAHSKWVLWLCMCIVGNSYVCKQRTTTCS